MGVPKVVAKPQIRDLRDHSLSIKHLKADFNNQSESFRPHNPGNYGNESITDPQNPTDPIIRAKPVCYGYHN